MAFVLLVSFMLDFVEYYTAVFLQKKNRYYQGKQEQHELQLQDVTLIIERILQDHGQVAKWLRRLTAEQNMDGPSQTPRPKVGCSLTVHPAANGYPVPTLGKLKVARKGTGHSTSLCRRLRISVLSIRHSPTYGILYGTSLYLLLQDL